MNLKKKTFIALTVKLLLSIIYVQAQNITDSTQQKNVSFFPFYANRSVNRQPILPNQLPSNFYAKRLPFFCAKELQVQKAVGIPVKFRLSTVEYCDKLEGKNRQ